MRIARLTVVLQGAANDKETFQSTVRMAAREGAPVRVVLGPNCSCEAYEKHLDFVLWDVQQRLGLPAPDIILESALSEADIQLHEVVGS